MSKCDCKKPIIVENGPKAIGPYSVGYKAENLIFTAGQIGLDPKNGALVSGGIEAETRQVFENIKAILAATGATLEDVVKTTVLLKDINDFGKMMRSTQNILKRIRQHVPHSRWQRYPKMQTWKSRPLPWLATA